MERPRHLAQQYAEQFADRSVARAYHARPPYPAAVFDLLQRLIVDEPRNVLELGAGTGDLTLRLAPRVGHLEAVEPAQAMLDIACAHACGIKNIDWVRCTAEEHAYWGRYALVVAAESFHWMNWAVVSAKIEQALTPRGLFAIVLERRLLNLPWGDELSALLSRFSTNQDYRPYDLIEQLAERSLFLEHGREQILEPGFVQSVSSYVESFHSRNGFSRERMGSAAAAFDRELLSLIERHDMTGSLTATIATTVVWGRPVTDAEPRLDSPSPR